MNPNNLFFRPLDREPTGTFQLKHFTPAIRHINHLRICAIDALTFMRHRSSSAFQFCAPVTSRNEAIDTQPASQLPVIFDSRSKLSKSKMKAMIFGSIGWRKERNPHPQVLLPCVHVGTVIIQ